MDFQALSERLKDAPDSGYNGQLPLATLKDQNKSLSVPEILHLLRLAFTNHLVPAICVCALRSFFVLKPADTYYIFIAFEQDESCWWSGASKSAECTSVANSNQQPHEV